jgi:type IV pilus assembly protein PilC
MKFKYRIFDQNTQIREGVAEGSSRQSVIDFLQEEGNIIVEVEEMASSYDLSAIQHFFETISNKDLVITIKQLASLISGGVQTLRAFRLIASDNASPAVTRVFGAIADDIQSGSMIWKSLSRHEDVFDGFFVSMVHAGEESGKLKETLEYLSDYLERNFDLTQKVKKALTYPIFVMVTFLVVMLIMTVFVIPKLAEMLIDQGRDLPWYTELVLGISNSIINYWYFLIAGGAGVYFYFNYLYSTLEGKSAIDSFKLKIPVIGNLYKKLFLARFADNLDTMLSSGLPLVEIIRITAEIMDNYVFKKVLERISDKVENGKTLSIAMSEEPLMPNIMVQMAKIGEETGALGYMLRSIATFYKKELERTIDKSLALLEPVMIVVLAGSVGFLIGSILLPLYDIATNIK